MLENGEYKISLALAVISTFGVKQANPVINSKFSNSAVDNSKQVPHIY